MCSCMASTRIRTPLAPSPVPALVTCTQTWPPLACRSSRRRATRHFATICRSACCSPRNSRSASTAPAFTNCSLEASWTAKCDRAPMAYSKMFSFRMNFLATSINTATASVLATKTRFSSLLAKFDRAPRASLATLRSSYALHAANAATMTSTTPSSPNCVRISGSVANWPKNPQPSFMTTGLSPNLCMDAIVDCMNPSPTMSSLYCALRDRLRTMPRAASVKAA
mmetsp:Transcript_60340/g.184324  ORF Transcript_60340/g.184324 Transcript_60340/m.184324 type:complete len:225 (+) Transcript_60340:234-908(+)